MIPPPQTYGLPAKFQVWRPNQPQAIVRAIQAAQRWSVVVAPTGFGKMVVAETIARFGGRSAYLTVTKGLQDQVAGEIVDRYDIRGRANYQCPVLADSGMSGWRASVEQADSSGMCDSCHLKDRACDYYARMRQVKLAHHVNTNYAKWLTGDEETFGRFDVLVADEAHNVPDQISNAVRVELKGEAFEEFTGRPVPPSMPMPEWVSWAVRQVGRLGPRLDALQAAVSAGSRSKVRELRDLRAFVRGLERLANAGEGWLEDRSAGDRVTFEPVWPRAYGELLWRGIGKVVLLSATVRPKTLQLMGIDPSLADFAEYPSSFPVARRPVVAVRTVAQRNGMSDDERLEAVRRVDQIIGMRLGRNGIIHTVSFDRARHLFQHSQYAHLMLLNDPKARDTAAIVEQFRRSEGRVLVTPSVMEGYDFPGRQCEWQVIYKVPLLNRHASVVADARCKEDSEYDGYQAMQKIVQASGRAMRSASDSAETLITDDTWDNWFYKANRKHAPGWFNAAVRETAGGLLPRPLDKL